MANSVHVSALRATLITTTFMMRAEKNSFKLQRNMIIQISTGTMDIFDAKDAVRLRSLIVDAFGRRLARLHTLQLRRTIL